jgi:gliding motility-associated-like protein
MKRFEDIIQEKLNNFEYPYQQGAWENYRRRIQMKKIFHWGFASIIIIGAITTAVLLLNTPDKIITQKPVNKISTLITQNKPVSANTPAVEIKSNENKPHEIKNKKQQDDASTNNQQVAQITTNDLVNSTVKTLNNNVPNTVSASNISFTKNISQGCAPLSVQFTAMNISKNCKCMWNFGDGTTSSENNPIHIYQKGGKYKVGLTVKCSEKENYTTDFQIVQAFSKPVAIFSYTCEGNAVDFESKSKQVTYHKWMVGDTTSSSEYWKYEITRSGKYTVQYIVENNDGCADTSTKEINFQYKMPVQICNSFKPDGDGLNDFFGPQVVNYANYKFTMTIFNKKTGRCVYEANGSPLWWDGNDKETKQPCPADIYYYKIMAVDKQGNKNEYTGKIQLLR